MEADDGENPWVEYKFKEPVTVDVSALFEAVRTATPAVETCAIGDTISTSDMELTLSELTIVPTLVVGGINFKPLNDDMIFARFTLTVKNTSKEKLDLDEVLNVKIDYNDGYIYSTEEEDSYIINPDDPVDFRLFTCGHSSHGAIFELSPLASDTVYLGIPCAPLILEDEESPLKAVFTLPDGDGEREFELIVR